MGGIENFNVLKYFIQTYNRKEVIYTSCFLVLEVEKLVSSLRSYHEPYNSLSYLVICIFY